MADKPRAPRKTEKMRQRSVRLPVKLDDEITALAEQENIDKAELIRWGVRFVLRMMREDQALRTQFLQMIREEQSKG